MYLWLPLPSAVGTVSTKGQWIYWGFAFPGPALNNHEVASLVSFASLQGSSVHCEYTKKARVRSVPDRAAAAASALGLAWRLRLAEQ